MKEKSIINFLNSMEKKKKGLLNIDDDLDMDERNDCEAIID